jgi:hypothetical protein
MPEITAATLLSVMGKAVPYVYSYWRRIGGALDRSIGHRVIVNLSGRDVLFEKYSEELPPACLTSVHQIRQILTTELEGRTVGQEHQLPTEDLADILNAMRDASADFCRAVERLRSLPSAFGIHHLNPPDRSRFITALSHYRVVMAEQIGLLVVACDLSVPEKFLKFVTGTGEVPVDDELIILSHEHIREEHLTPGTRIRVLFAPHKSHGVCKGTIISTREFWMDGDHGFKRKDTIVKFEDEETHQVLEACLLDDEEWIEIIAHKGQSEAASASH